MQKYLVAIAAAVLSLHVWGAESPSDSEANKEACAQYLAAKKEGKAAQLKEGVKCVEEKKAKAKPLHDHGKVHKNQ